MVAVTMRAGRGHVRRLRVAWPVWRRRVVGAAAGAAGRVVRAVLAVALAVRGLAAVALISYGAWLAYAPAGFIVAGVLLLADRVLDERQERGEPVR